MLFHHHNKKLPNNISLQINLTEIERVTNFIFLGVTIIFLSFNVYRFSCQLCKIFIYIYFHLVVLVFLKFMFLYVFSLSDDMWQLKPM